MIAQYSLNGETSQSGIRGNRGWVVNTYILIFPLVTQTQNGHSIVALLDSTSSLLNKILNQMQQNPFCKQAMLTPHAIIYVIFRQCYTTLSKIHNSLHSCTILFFVHLIGKTQNILWAKNIWCNWSCLIKGARNWQLDWTRSVPENIMPSQNVIKSAFLCFATPTLHSHCTIHLSPPLLALAYVQFPNFIYAKEPQIVAYHGLFSNSVQSKEQSNMENVY